MIENKQRLILFFLLVFLVGVVVLQFIFIRSRSVTQFTDHQKIELTVNGQVLHVEVVNTPQSMSKGLGDRTQIGSDGMAFLLGSPQTLPFWMKDMHFDLDLVWVKDKKVDSLNENVKAPQTPEENQDQRLQRYYPEHPVDMVLELPAGATQKLNIKKGDILHF